MTSLPEARTAGPQQVSRERDKALQPAERLSHPYWVLFVLVLVFAINFVDRSIVYILQEGIKGEFRLTDTQMGLLGGPAFGLCYAICGIPLARLAEKHSRRLIIASAAAAWSLMTALCGIAQNFAQLVAARSLVAVGEAGSTPPSHSIISDYFPPERRATALAIYTVAVPIGMLSGSALGGALAGLVGWRWTFILMALPGFIAALLTLTIREPRRGRVDTDLPAEDAVPSFREVLVKAVRTPAYFHVVAGMSLYGLGVYAVMNFTAVFLIRRFGLETGAAGTAFGLIYGVAAGAGTLVGGALADRLAKRNPKAYGIVPAVCMAAAAPLFMLGFSQSSAAAAIVVLLAPGVLHTGHIGASYGIIQNSFPTRMRATAVAITMLASAALGMSLGPPIVGMLSDMFAAAAYPGNYAAACVGATADAACRTASGVGLQRALVAISPVFLWAALHYVLVARHLPGRRLA